MKCIDMYVFIIISENILIILIVFNFIQNSALIKVQLVLPQITVIIYSQPDKTFLTFLPWFQIYWRVLHLTFFEWRKKRMISSKSLLHVSLYINWIIKFCLLGCSVCQGKVFRILLVNTLILFPILCWICHLCYKKLINTHSGSTEAITFQQ